MIHPDGSSISYKYNNDGQITNRIDAKGNVEFWQYDNTKRLIKYLNPLGDELTYNYIDDNRLPNSLYKNGKLISEYQYNAANQLTLSKSDSIIQQWRYDAYGRLSYFNPKESITIGLKRDTLGRVATFSQSQKSDIQISYDAYDLPIKIADNKLQMEFDYTPMGSLKKQLSYNTHDKKNTRALHFFYDDYENLIGISNEKNEKYKFIRNKRDEVVEEIEFDGTQKIYIRDADGLVTKRIDSHGTEVHYQYDVAGRLTHVVYDDGDYEAYYYDASGLLIEAENQHNSVQFQRNALGQVTQEKQGEVLIDYQYNKKGQLVGIGSSLGANINYDYNNYGDLSQVTAFNTKQGIEKDNAWQAIMHYTNEGQLQKQEFSGGVQSEFDYDHSGRITGQKIHVATKQTLDKKFYWNPENKLNQVFNQLTQKHTAYYYDDFGGLSAAKFEDGFVQFKTPDQVGNIYETKSQKDRVYDKGGKLLRDRKWYYHYDNKGNLQLKTKRKLFETQKSNKPQKPQNLQELFPLSFQWSLLGNNLKDTNFDLEVDHQEISSETNWNLGDWFYQWTSNGMLKRVKTPEGKEIKFEYDALGRRTTKIANNKIYRYIWDADVLLHEWHYPLSERPVLQINENGDLEYSHPEPVENLITWLYQTDSFVPCGKIENGEKYSIVSDYLGRPIQVFNKYSNIVWSADYDIYGKLLNLKGEKQFVPFRQLGQYEDEELGGLYYNRFRYYDSESGLYISKDPIGLAGGNPTLYGYVSDSNKFTDVFGLSEGSGTLGRNMTKANMTHGLDPFVRGDFQAHHVIPHEVWVDNQKFFNNIGLGGAKDLANNGVFLPKNQAVANQYGFDFYHRGSHPDINTDMRTKVENVAQRYNNKEISKRQARKEISKIQKAERSRLSQRSGTGKATKCH